jgi:fumarate reductase flavoprotein subunit
MLTNNINSREELTRRDFVSASAAAAVVGACVSHSACAQEASSSDEEMTSQKKQYSFEIPPDPIPDDQIVDVTESEIVIVGAGVSGIPAAMKAAEMGADVQVIEKQSQITPYTPTGMAAINSTALKEAGAVVDRDEIIHEFMGPGNAYRGNQELVALYVDKSGEVVDWITDVLAQYNVPVQIGAFEAYYLHIDNPKDAPLNMPDKDPYYNFWPFQHMYGSSTTAQIDMMVDDNEHAYLQHEKEYAESKGATFTFDMRAVQLIREEDGERRVTGVVAQDADGNYHQYNASKGVLLCTGGFDHDKEMLERYYPLGLRMIPSGQPWFTGDGHKMAIWVGANMEENCCSHTLGNRFTGTTLEGAEPNMGWEDPWITWDGPSNAMAPTLYVNSAGKRFMNEELGYFCSAYIIDAQPGHMMWALWDDDWETKLTSHTFGRFCDGEDTREMNEKNIERGFVYAADTLEELAEKMNVPADALISTVETYNKACADGYDQAFIKNPRWLTTIEKPPFYASPRLNGFMTTRGGVSIDANLHVLDTEGMIIPGLYAGANPAGSIYGNTYLPQIPMSASGVGITLSYCAVESIVNGL